MEIRTLQQLETAIEGVLVDKEYSLLTPAIATDLILQMNTDFIFDFSCSIAAYKLNSRRIKVHQKDLFGNIVSKTVEYRKSVINAVNIDLVIAELKREQTMRLKVYSRMVQTGQLHKTRANAQYSAMNRALKLVKFLKSEGITHI